MGERFTVRLSDENAEWVTEESTDRDRSKAWVINEAVNTVRGADSTYSHRTGDDTDSTDADGEEILTRLAALEERVNELEDNDTETVPPAVDEAPARPDRPPAPGRADDPDGDVVGDALQGWSYGRTEEEQAANDAVARASLEWLRETGDAVQQGDVPLDEMADVDSQGRTTDTLWRTVIRGAWQHATGLEYVEKPDSRSYQWAAGAESYRGE